MRLSLFPPPQDCTWEELESIWRAADEIEVWETAWTADHFYPIFSDPTGPSFEGWTALAFLAARTKRIRVGVLVSGMPHRHPAVVAKMAATLDLACGGRLEVGLGAAWNDEDLSAYGIELGSVSDRIDRLEEGVEVVSRLLSEETVDFHGRHYRLAAARCSPRPFQEPRPPIVIGGSGDRRVLEIAARWADHWNVGPIAPAEVARRKVLLAERCRAHGRDPNAVLLSASVLSFDLDHRGIRDAVAAYGDAGCGMVVVHLPRYDLRDLEDLSDLLAPLSGT